MSLLIHSLNVKDHVNFPESDPSSRTALVTQWSVKFVPQAASHTHIWEGGFLAPRIHFCTRQAEWLTTRPAPSVPVQKQSGAFRFHRPLVYLLLLRRYINQQTKHYTCNNLFLFSTTTCFGCIHQPSSGRHRFKKG